MSETTEVTNVTSASNIAQTLNPMASSASIHSSNKKPKYAHAVFEGGGVRGIGHVGAVEVAERCGYKWQHVAGTSAGAIVAAFLAAGYTANEMYTIMKEVDYKRFADGPAYDLLHISEVFNMLTHGGMHTGSYVEAFVREKLLAKGIRTFKDLKTAGQENNPNPFLCYCLTVIASDITTGQLLRLPQDAHVYGIDPDALDVARAVHMSASIPFFFTPMHFMHADGSDSRIVDGGLLSNFPLFLFEQPDIPPDIPTFGFRLVDPAPTSTVVTSGMIQASYGALDMVKSLISTMLSAHDKLYMNDATYVRTIAIPVNGISSTQFDLTAQQAQQLYENGKAAASKFFSTWDFEAYRLTYGIGEPPSTSRIQQLHTAMKEQVVQQTAQLSTR